MPKSNDVFETSDISSVTPSDSIEDVLVEIWTELLCLETVSIHDDFFELGGQSLLATQLISRLRETFQIELPLTYIFKLSTIAQLAQQIETILWATQANQSSSKAAESNRKVGEL